MKFTLTTQKLIKKMIAYPVWPEKLTNFLGGKKLPKQLPNQKSPNINTKAQLESSKHLTRTTFKT